jgi:hypothetical protein
MSRIMKVDPRDLGKFEKRLAQRVRLSVPTALRKAGRRAVGLLKERSSGIKDLGAFQVGWAAVVGFNDLELLNRCPWWIYVEMGRRAGARPPPIAAILPWVIRHLGNPDLAWVVARNIGIRGIKARPVLKDPAVFEQIRIIVLGELSLGVRDAMRAAS